jgi:DNA-binding NtrC family response regulator
MRGNDILLLAHSFLRNVCERQHKKEISLTEDAKAFLLQYQWPGNVRELNNLLEGIVSISGSDLISADIIIQYLGYEETGPISSIQALMTESSELEQMKRALRENRGNRCKAAESLGMSRSTFYRRLREHGLDNGKSDGTL